MKILLLILAFIVFITPTKVYADISLLVHESKGFTEEVTGVGHITIYLSNLCTDAPLVLRQCNRDELKGVVISTYPGLGINTEYTWFAIPVLAYLYGIETEPQIPLYANGNIRRFLLESNRAKYFSKQIPRLKNEKLPSGRWSELFGTALDRDLYAFTVKTTAEQDLQFLNKYSQSPAENDFNVITNNCADFTKDVINFYFPNSASRDLINDFGITTPKAIARSFKNYAIKRPDLHFHIEKYSQIDGTILRSSEVQNLTEMAFRSKKYVAAQALTMPMLLPIFTGTYFLSGRSFNIDAAYHQYSSARMADRLYQFGEGNGWTKYRQKFSEMLEKSINERLFANNREVKSFYDNLESNSEPFYDDNGDLMLKVSAYGKEKFLGLTRRNILNANSDVRLAYKLLLVKVKYELNAPEKNRETLEVLQENWQLLMELSKRAAELPPIQNPNNAQFLTKSNNKMFKNKILNLFRKITH